MAKQLSLKVVSEGLKETKGALKEVGKNLNELVKGFHKATDQTKKAHDSSMTLVRGYAALSKQMSTVTQKLNSVNQANQKSMSQIGALANSFSRSTSKMSKSYNDMSENMMKSAQKAEEYMGKMMDTFTKYQERVTAREEKSALRRQATFQQKAQSQSNMSKMFMYNIAGNKLEGFSDAAMGKVKQMGEKLYDVGSSYEYIGAGLQFAYGAQTQNIMDKALKTAQETNISTREVLDATRSMGVLKINPFSQMTAPTGKKQSALKSMADLAALVPQQGMEGAQFAIRNALSGQWRSLQMRFDIPLNMIEDMRKGITATMTQQERFDIIMQGITKHFGGLMSSVENTTKFHVDNIKDIVDNIIYAVTKDGNSMIGQFVGQVEKALLAFQKNEPAIKRMGETISSVASALVTVARPFLGIAKVFANNAGLAKFVFFLVMVVAVFAKVAGMILRVRSGMLLFAQANLQAAVASDAAAVASKTQAGAMSATAVAADKAAVAARGFGYSLKAALVTTGVGALIVFLGEAWSYLSRMTDEAQQFKDVMEGMDAKKLGENLSIATNQGQWAEYGLQRGKKSTVDESYNYSGEQVKALLPVLQIVGETLKGSGASTEDVEQFQTIKNRFNKPLFYTGEISLSAKEYAFMTAQATKAKKTIEGNVNFRSAQPETIEEATTTRTLAANDLKKSNLLNWSAQNKYAKEILMAQHKDNPNYVPPENEINAIGNNLFRMAKENPSGSLNDSVTKLNKNTFGVKNPANNSSIIGALASMTENPNWQSSKIYTLNDKGMPDLSKYNSTQRARMASALSATDMLSSSKFSGQEEKFNIYKTQGVFQDKSSAELLTSMETYAKSNNLPKPTNINDALKMSLVKYGTEKEDYWKKIYDVLVASGINAESIVAPIKETAAATVKLEEVIPPMFREIFDQFTRRSNLSASGRLAFMTGKGG